MPPLADISWLANPTLAFAVCVMADVWGWIPFLTLVLIGGLASIPRDTIGLSMRSPSLRPSFSIIVRTQSRAKMRMRSSSKQRKNLVCPGSP